jgi:hypothetical protein
VEKSAEVDRQHSGIIVVGMLNEWLSDEDASIVDKRVDATESIERLRNNFFCRYLIAVAGDRENIRSRRRLDLAGVRNHAVISIAICLDQSFADTS